EVVMSDRTIWNILKACIAIFAICAFVYVADLGYYKWQCNNGFGTDKEMSECAHCGVSIYSWNVYDCPRCKRAAFRRGYRRTCIAQSIFFGPTTAYVDIWTGPKPKELN